MLKLLLIMFFLMGIAFNTSFANNVIHSKFIIPTKSKGATVDAIPQHNLLVIEDRDTLEPGKLKFYNIRDHKFRDEEYDLRPPYSRLNPTFMVSPDKESFIYFPCDQVRGKCFLRIISFANLSSYEDIELPSTLNNFQLSPDKKSVLIVPQTTFKKPVTVYRFGTKKLESTSLFSPGSTYYSTMPGYIENLEVNSNKKNGLITLVDSESLKIVKTIDFPAGFESFFTIKYSSDLSLLAICNEALTVYNFKEDTSLTLKLSRPIRQCHDVVFSKDSSIVSISGKSALISDPESHIEVFNLKKKKSIFINEKYESSFQPPTMTNQFVNFYSRVSNSMRYFYFDTELIEDIRPDDTNKHLSPSGDFSIGKPTSCGFELEHSRSGKIISYDLSLLKPEIGKDLNCFWPRPRWSQNGKELSLNVSASYRTANYSERKVVAFLEATMDENDEMKSDFFYTDGPVEGFLEKPRYWKDYTFLNEYFFYGYHRTFVRKRGELQARAVSINPESTFKTVIEFNSETFVVFNIQDSKNTGLVLIPLQQIIGL